MITSHEKLLLVVVAKAPVLGTVKTRLYSDLTPETATELYGCFLQDRISEMGTLKGVDLAIAYTPEDSRAYFTAFTSNGFDLFPQEGKDLGERLNNIFVQKATEEYDAVVIIDSDSPDLPKSIVEESFEILSSGRTEAVFGPCFDGGYFLVGLRNPHPELFQAIPWSTAVVLQKTLETAAKKGVKTKLLQPWNDLDTFEDLLAYFHKYKDAPPENAGTGNKTFEYLTRLESITRRKMSSVP
jgi:uncharacterized protein